jgi:hypothetical protein
MVIDELLLRGMTGEFLDQLPGPVFLYNPPKGCISGIVP